jgi:UDP-glucose 4-epimerase
MKVLGVDGAGYIGSHMLWLLTDASHQVVTMDSLSNGYRDTQRSVPSEPQASSPHPAKP